jgi:hypothetical protein
MPAVSFSRQMEANQDSYRQTPMSTGIAFDRRQFAYALNDERAGPTIRNPGQGRASGSLTRRRKTKFHGIYVAVRA